VCGATLATRCDFIMNRANQRVCVTTVVPRGPMGSCRQSICYMLVYLCLVKREGWDVIGLTGPIAQSKSNLTPSIASGDAK
jgi:hypothetical protein